MKLFKRTKWKPKQKLRKDDIPMLVAEYRSLKEASHLMTSMILTLTAMFALIAIAFREFATEQGVMWLFIIYFVGISSFFGRSLYSDRKASKIAEVLEIKKRLERYDID